MHKILDPWTGNVYPVANPEPWKRPKGYFGDGLSARYEYFSPDELIDHWRFMLESKQRLLPSVKYQSDRDRMSCEMADLEAKIAHMRLPDSRLARLSFLIEHRQQIMAELKDETAPAIVMVIEQWKAEIQEWKTTLTSKSP